MRCRPRSLMTLVCVMGGVFSGCSSLTTPVLRHEIGEALGQGHYRIRGQIETARLFPLAPASIGAAGMTQAAGAFQGVLFGIQGAAGLLPRWDLQLGTFYSAGGGGWRLGSKYQFLYQNNFAVAGMVGFGRYAAKGSSSYATPTGAQSVTQTFSGSSLDISIPVSYRFGTSVVLYSGLNYYANWVSGSADLTYVSDTTHDIGTNLGLKLIFGRFEGDAEIAIIRAHDPFMDESRFVPYFGISVGLLF